MHRTAGACHGASLMHPTGLGLVWDSGTSRPWVPTYVGRSGARNVHWWVEPLGSRFRGNDDGGGGVWGVVHLKMHPTGRCIFNAPCGFKHFK